MNPEIKKRWIEALRSGKYSQAKGALKNAEGFCCLGVLCDITKEETGGYWQGFGFIRHGQNTVVYPAETDLLPNFVSEYVDINYNPKVNGKRLAELNDTGKTFLEIAELIENSPL